MDDSSNNCKTISILLVANESFRIRLTDSLKSCFKKYHKKYELTLIFCENVSEIKKISGRISADFVVFVMDTETRTCVKNVEYNLQLMSKDFICGRTCIVNGNAHIPLVKMGVSLNDIIALRHKYGCTLINANVMDSTSCLHLANRLINLITSSLGLNKTAPFLPWLSC